MKNFTVGLTVAALCSMIALPVPAQSTVSDKIRAAQQQSTRSADNRARDRNRDPVAAMNFCRLNDDMTVIEFAPGGGWYTELLGPVLQDRGALYIAHTAERLARLDDRLKLEPLSKVRKLPIPSARHPERRKIVFRSLDFGLTTADLLLNIREYHNIDSDSVGLFNRATYAALKPGGYYCIIDHTRRHMAQNDGENRRRMDPVLVIKQVQAAGFRFLDFTPLFYRPDDELRYEVGRRTVRGNTDRFTLLFQKPGG
ncbi:MAG: methyltransferase [Proteobacteria bacterium]|nr:methyltransferase [Pseudomonadota bacterium]